jgi:hypothetical protein
MTLAVPAVAAAEPSVDAAVAKYQALGLTQLASMPSGRALPDGVLNASNNWGYRTYEQMNAEMDALAAANPTKVAVKTAARPSTEGRTIKYLEITNNVTASSGKPVFFLMGAIHGNEQAAGEDSLEFAYDVLNTGKTNAKVAALLDEVKLIVMPVVNVDGWVRFRRQSCGGPVTPPSTCSTSGVDMNRNYPFGWGSNIGVSFAQRGSGPGSEPEVQNTMDIVRNNQVVSLVTMHTNSHALFYPGLEVAAGFPADLDLLRGVSVAMANATNNGYTNVRDSAHDYETSGETVDWSYYATRGFAVTFEVVGGSCSSTTDYPNRSTQTPSYVRCTTPDYTGTSHPTATPAMIANYGNHPVRNGLYQALVHATIPSGHAQLTGTAAPGATLKITKDFDLYTNRVQQQTTPPSSTAPIAIPTHLESSLTVPANGRFTWDVNPSVRPVPPYRAEGMVPGPNGYYQESWTLTCTAADGTVLDTRQVKLDRGESTNLSLCTPGDVGGTVPATLALTLGTPASFGAFTPGVAKDYTATSTAAVISTAGDATLSVADPSATAPGHLVNGAFSLPAPLQVAAGSAAFAAVGGPAAPTTLKTYSAPVSNDQVTVNYKQPIAAADALRTGTYAKTLTFTLATTQP